MTLRIDRVGITTVQDLGRPGWAHAGVPRSGAADRSSHRIANRLVGNSPNRAALETSGGLVLTALEDSVVAIAGAECDASVDGRAVPHCTALKLSAGTTLRVDRLVNGMRAYVAVSGGIRGEPLLGSLSQDTLGGIAPVPLASGAVLAVGVSDGAPTGLDVPITPQLERSLRIDPGPHIERLDADFVVRLSRTPLVVSATGDRIGVRLRGELGSAGAGGELESIPLVRGAVQVTPDDELVVMLADHPTTGGYPVIGIVHPGDVDRLAQCPAGSAVVLVR